VIRFLTATLGHADVQITCSIRMKTLSYRIRSRSHKYVLTWRLSITRVSLKTGKTQPDTQTIVRTGFEEG